MMKIMLNLIFQMMNKQNFDEQDITSGFIMNLIKLTQQNIRLGKQTINNERKHNENINDTNRLYIDNVGCNNFLLSSSSSIRSFD